MLIKNKILEQPGEWVHCHTLTSHLIVQYQVPRTIIPMLMYPVKFEKSPSTGLWRSSWMCDKNSPWQQQAQGDSVCSLQSIDHWNWANIQTYQRLHYVELALPFCSDAWGVQWWRVEYHTQRSISSWWSWIPQDMDYFLFISSCEVSFRPNQARKSLKQS